MRRVLIAFLLAVALLACAPTTQVPLQLSAAAQQKQVGNSKTRVKVDKAYRIYHCPGSKLYRATKGEEMYQYLAQRKGYRPAYGWVCT